MATALTEPERTRTELAGGDPPPLAPRGLVDRAWSYVSPVAAALVGITAAFHLAAWARGDMWLRGLTALTMKANAAFGLLLLSVALLLLLGESPGRLRRWAARPCAGLAALIGGLTLLENLSGWDLGIDQLLARELPGALGVTAPNRMGTPGSTALLLSAVGLLLLARGSPRAVRWHQILSLIVGLLGLLPLVGYLYGVSWLHRLARVTAIAWPTALSIVVLAVGMFCARPTRALLAQVTVRDAGGAVIRRLLLPVLALPIALGALAVAGIRAGHLDPTDAIATLTVTFLVWLTVLTWRAGRRGSRVGAELARQRELLAVTLGSVGDALLACDAEGRITFINPAAAALTGWKAEEAVGQPMGAVFRVADGRTGAAAEDALARVLHEGREVALADHTVLLTRAGTRIPIEESVAPIRDGHGAVAGAVLVFHDVTEQRRAHEALRESEQRFRLALRNAPVWVGAQDRELRYVWAYNPRPVGPGGVVGARDEDLLPPDQAARLTALKRRVLEEGIEIREQLWLDPPSGRVFVDACWEPIRDPAGQVVGVASAALDLTSMKAAEEALRRFELVVQQSRDAILFMRRSDGRILEANEAATAVYGYRRDELLARTIHDLRAPEGAGDAAQQMVEADTRGVLFETLHRRKDGSVFPVEVSSRGADVGETRTLVSVVRDITERRRADEREREQRREAERRADELREADRRKNEFLAVLSHELRNPLAPIRNSLHLLARVAPGSEQAGRAQEVIERQVRQLGRLVDDLLDVTRISRGKIRLQRERLELNEVVRGTGEDHRALFEREGVALEVAVPPRPLYADADRTRIAQVIGNLLQNAAKFTPGGGRARLSLQESGEGEAVIEVADTGAGIDAELLRQLFVPFVQADETLARSRGGLGLGLALVKGLVELHGGSVSAWSEGAGRGATFVVRLPLVAALAPEERAPAPAPAAPAMQILLIEDNEDAALSLKEVLELSGHAVDVAFTGRQGLEKAHARRPDAILCDLGLPELDGFAVVRAVRADPALRHTLLVALSGYASSEDVQRALDAGFDRHMAKPPDLAALADLLAAAAGG